MATFNSNEVTLRGNRDDVFARLSNPEALKSFLDKTPREMIPDDKLSLLDSIEITHDTISISGGPTGKLTLRLSEAIEPSRIVYEGIGTPVRLALEFQLLPGAIEDTCGATVGITADIPAMLKPMISGPLQKGAGQFAQMLATIPSWK